MPELPEVETVARQLAPLLVGRRVVAFEVFDPKLAIADPAAVAGRKIKAIERCGKQILITFSPALYLCIHLRMTGRLLYRGGKNDLEIPKKPSPLRARWRLDRGVLIFHDTRRFGTIRILESAEAARPVGADPTAADFTQAGLKKLIGDSRTPIKPWLLRQDRLVGIGNIYASEALFVARVHPARRANSLSDAEIKGLHRGLREVLRRSIKAGGTTFSDFQNARGDIGNYQHNLKVYDHAGEPCPRCGGAVERLVQQQRSTYLCPRCQRVSGPN